METELLKVELLKVKDLTNKIAVIKIISEITGLSLMEAKELTDKANIENPQTIKKDVPRPEAEAMKTKLEKAGAWIGFGGELQFIEDTLRQHSANIFYIMDNKHWSLPVLARLLKSIGTDKRFHLVQVESFKSLRIFKFYVESNELVV